MFLQVGKKNPHKNPHGPNIPFGFISLRPPGKIALSPAGHWHQPCIGSKSPGQSIQSAWAKKATPPAGRLGTKKNGSHSCSFRRPPFLPSGPGPWFEGGPVGFWGGRGVPFFPPTVYSPPPGLNQSNKFAP
jgi:hypothetical protein